MIALALFHFIQRILGSYKGSIPLDPSKYTSTEFFDILESKWKYNPQQ